MNLQKRCCSLKSILVSWYDVGRHVYQQTFSIPLLKYKDTKPIWAIINVNRLSCPNIDTIKLSPKLQTHTMVNHTTKMGKRKEKKCDNYHFLCFKCSNIYHFRYVRGKKSAHHKDLPASGKIL